MLRESDWWWVCWLAGASPAPNMSRPGAGSSLFASLRQLLATALEIAQVRLDLLSTELEFEKRRLFDGLLWAAAALLVLGVSLALFCGFVVLLFWESYRLTAVGVLALLFLLASLLLLRQARQRLRHAGGLLHASVTELKRDCVELKSTGQHEHR